MKQFIDATRKALEAENWYAALFIAFTLPDICGYLENPKKGSQARFEFWFDKYMLKRYQAYIGPDHVLHTFLCGSDCYALRCAFLHQGEFGIDDQRAQQALKRFHFVYPCRTMFVHLNQINDSLQLQVDQFCCDICKAVEQWLEDIKGNREIDFRIKELAVISNVGEWPLH